uniref:Uncharacterized protein n=1 Tax=Lepeophtheirus salmonis TaxID=72036 RepID=A0A0K2UXA7_LEPSM
MTLYLNFTMYNGGISINDIITNILH